MEKSKMARVEGARRVRDEILDNRREGVRVS